MVLAGGEGLPSQRLLVPHVDPVQRPLGRTAGAATLSPSVRASEAFRQLQSQRNQLDYALRLRSLPAGCLVNGPGACTPTRPFLHCCLLPVRKETSAHLASGPAFFEASGKALPAHPPCSPSLLTPASLCSPVLTTLRHPLSPPARERTAPAPPTRQPSVGRAGLLAFSCLLSQPPGEQRAGAGGGGVCVWGCSPEITFSFTIPRGHRPQAKPGQEVRLSFG